MLKLVLGVVAASAIVVAPAHAGSRRSADRLIRRCANDQRVAAGLPGLRRSTALDRAAQLQAQNMLRRGFFSHTDPFGWTPARRVRHFDRFGSYSGVGENIAFGYGSVRAACGGWLRSSGHRANILGPYTHVGGGYARGRSGRVYYVQVFARARR
jgi:uncharacterized protein YkwD